MHIRSSRNIGIVMMSCVALLTTFVGVSSANPDQGLTVCVGPRSVEELTELYAGEGMLLHGLVRSAEEAESMRRVLREKQLVGPINVSFYDGQTIPFIDNTVNTVILAAGAETPKEEVLRVLAPGGKVEDTATGLTLTKPWPDDIDEWPQYLHDPGNNAVAHDDRVGPPKHLQWRAGPRWSRHHDHMSSVSAVVSAGGKVFTIMDEGSVASILLPSEWRLIARDAFNGVRLWDEEIDEWHSRVFGLKSGPATLPRRLATDGERVYVTLGINAPVSVLDAETGETLQTLSTEGHPREILLVNDMVLVVTSDEPMYKENAKPRTQNTIHAFEKETGKRLWKRQGPVCLVTLAADSQRVYFYDLQSVVALDRNTGEDLWSSPQRALKTLLSQDAPILVVHEGVVLFAEPQYGQMVGQKGKVQQLVALDAANGKQLWQGEQPKTGYRSIGDVLVVDNLVWNGPTTSGAMSGIQTGRDPRTGETVRSWPPTVDTYWFHHRCYRAKATDKYLMLSRTGIEYIDIETGDWNINHYVRGACLYGIMPANGLTYAPPHPCSCYPETKLDGFVALAAASSLTDGLPEPGADAERRLEKGPAYEAPSAADATAADWPTFRYAMDRCGYSTITAGEDLESVWSVNLGAKSTQPIVVGDRLYVSTPETNSIHALDATSGSKVWSFTAGGRSDTPPTWHKGRLLFGATDGYVYCLNAEDGSLAWRFRAAPLDRRQVHFERVESVWPIHGNILVNRDEAVFVAGRSIFLDGGLRFIRLDAMTGKLVHESLLDRTDDRTGENIQEGIQRLNMPVGLPDVLGSDGERIFMRSEILNADGQRLGQAPHSTAPIEVILDRPADDAHLFAPSGFADDNWWHRTYWSYGSVFTGGHDGYYQSGRFVPSGRILVHDGDKVYGYCRKKEYYRWISTNDYHLFAAPRQQPVLGPEQRRLALGGGKNPLEKSYHVEMEWTGEIPIMLRALAGAGKHLILAGPPEVFDEKKATGDDKSRLAGVVADPVYAAMIEDQQSALDGEIGGKLMVVNPATGEMLHYIDLPSPPVFDGLVVANGSVYMCTLDGAIRCFGGK